MNVDVFNRSVRITLGRDDVVKLHKAMRFLLTPLDANAKGVDFQFVGTLEQELYPIVRKHLKGKVEEI